MYYYYGENKRSTIVSSQRTGAVTSGRYKIRNKYGCLADSTHQYHSDKCNRTVCADSACMGPYLNEWEPATTSTEMNNVWDLKEQPDGTFSIENCPSYDSKGCRALYVASYSAVRSIYLWLYHVTQDYKFDTWTFEYDTYRRGYKIMTKKNCDKSEWPCNAVLSWSAYGVVGRDSLKVNTFKNDENVRFALERLP